MGEPWIARLVVLPRIPLTHPFLSAPPSSPRTRPDSRHDLTPRSDVDAGLRVLRVVEVVLIILRDVLVVVLLVVGVEHARVDVVLHERVPAIAAREGVPGVVVAAV